MQRNTREIAASRARYSWGNRRTAMRVMHRKSIGMVAVFEQDPPTSNARRALVFESTRSRTRLDEFPAEWQRLSDDELAAIRRAAE